MDFCGKKSTVFELFLDLKSEKLSIFKQNAWIAQKKEGFERLSSAAWLWSQKAKLFYLKKFLLAKELDVQVSFGNFFKFFHQF